MTQKKYSQDEALYNSLLEWKNHSLKAELKSLIEDQKVYPFLRLGNLIQLFSEKMKNYTGSISEI